MWERKKISQWQWQFILDGYDKANLTIVRGKNLIYRPPLHASEGIYVFIREPLLNISALPSSCEITPATYTASPWYWHHHTFWYSLFLFLGLMWNLTCKQMTKVNTHLCTHAKYLWLCKLVSIDVMDKQWKDCSSVCPLCPHPQQCIISVYYCWNGRPLGLYLNNHFQQRPFKGSPQ